MTLTFLLDTGGRGTETSAVNVKVDADLALRLCSYLLRAIDESLGTNARVGQ